MKQKSKTKKQFEVARDVQNLWGAFRKAASEKIPDAVNTANDTKAFALAHREELAPIIDAEATLSKAHQSISEAKTADELLAAHSDHVDAALLPGDTAARLAARGILKGDQRNYFLSLLPLLDFAKQFADETDQLLDDAEAQLFAGFNAPVQETSLHGYVARFRQDIANIEHNIKWVTGIHDMTFLPNSTHVFHEPIQFERKPLLPPGVHISRVNPKTRFATACLKQIENAEQETREREGRGRARKAELEARATALKEAANNPQPAADDDSVQEPVKQE